MFNSKIFLTLFFLTTLTWSQVDEYETKGFLPAGKIVTIHGSFDGNKENTIFYLENSHSFIEPEIIEENLESMTVQIPDENYGLFEYYLNDSSMKTPLIEEVHILGFELNIGSTNMRRGQETELEIKILGTEGYQGTIPILVTNESKNIISLGNSEEQKIIIESDGISKFLTYLVKVFAKKRGGFSINVNFYDPPEPMLINYDFEKYYKNLLKQLSEKIKEEEKEKKNDENEQENEEITRKSENKPKYDGGDGTSESKCLCGITTKLSHNKDDITYKLAADMKKQEVAVAFKKSGTNIKTENSGFKRQDVPIVPGTAFTSGFNDVLGGYGNAFANAFGKAMPNGQKMSFNFKTENLSAQSSVAGNHVIEITPAKNEWSMAIGVVRLDGTVNSNAIDQTSFERQFFKEWDRGRKELEFINNYIGNVSKKIVEFIVDSMFDIAKKKLNEELDIKDIDEIRDIMSNTNTNVKAASSLSYVGWVNDESNNILLKSTAAKSYKIERGTFSKTKIRKNSDKTDGEFSNSIIVSDKHPTKISARVAGNTKIEIMAEGNGFAECSSETKATVLVVGFCVNEEGALKYDYIFDTGQFTANMDGATDAKKTK